MKPKYQKHFNLLIVVAVETLSLRCLYFVLQNNQIKSKKVRNFVLTHVSKSLNPVELELKVEG